MTTHPTPERFHSSTHVCERCLTSYARLTPQQSASLCYHCDNQASMEADALTTIAAVCICIIIAVCVATLLLGMRP